MNSINKCDLIMIALFIIILSVFGTYKYMHHEKPGDDLDKKVNDILNKKDNIIKQQETIEIPELPKKFFVEDYLIPEFSINSDGATILSKEVKNSP